MISDSEKRTVILNDDEKSFDSLIVNSYISFVDVLGKMALSKDASNEIENDAKIIYGWLGQKIGGLTEKSTTQLKEGILGYLAIGLSPSFEQQDIFDRFNKRSDAKTLMEKKPPTEVMDAFDRLIATSEQIRVKRKHDIDNETKEIKKVFDKIKGQEPFVGRVKTWIGKLSKRKKLFVGFTFLWSVWVMIITSQDLEILGHYISQWDGDMVLVNVLIVPVGVYFVYYIYNYIKKDF